VNSLALMRYCDEIPIYRRTYLSQLVSFSGLSFRLGSINTKRYIKYRS